MKAPGKWAIGLLLSLVGVFLIFALDEVFIGSRPVFARDHIRETAAYLGSLGAYFLLVQYGISRGGSRGVWRHWPELLGVNALPLALGLVSWAVEPGRPEALYVALVILAFSVAGAALATRGAVKSQVKMICPPAASS